MTKFSAKQTISFGKALGKVIVGEKTLQKIKVGKCPKLRFSLSLILIFFILANGGVFSQTKQFKTQDIEKKVPVILIHGIGGSNLRQPRNPLDKGIRKPG